MNWIGTFVAGTGNLIEDGSTRTLSGIQGYFGILDIQQGVNISTPQIISANPGRIVLRHPESLAQIEFVGQGLTVQNVPLPNGLGSFPILTGGTITRIDYFFNAPLEKALIDGATPGLTAGEQRFLNDQANSFRDPSFLAFNATISVPNVSAADLGNAVFQSYGARNQQPLQNFLDQFNFIFTGSDGINNLFGGNNNDQLFGGAGFDGLNGGAGNDILDGGAGENVLDGGTGSDLYILDQGVNQVADNVLDTRDIDTVSYLNANQGIVFSLDGSAGFGAGPNQGAAAGDEVIGIERVIGTNFNDVIFGRELTTRDFDTLIGAGGDDTLVSGAGNDVLEGGAGFDTLDGGSGGGDFLGNATDRAVWQTRPEDVHFFLSQQGALLVAAPGGEGLDEVFNVELFEFAGQVFTANQLTFSNAQLRVGSDGNSPINGNNGADVIFGRGGNDSISGNGGNDTIEGETGNDQIFGGQGSDVAYGGLGNDLLRGGAQGDDLFGGFGNDTLQGENGNDFLVGGAGADDLRGGGGIDTASYVGSFLRNVADLDGKNAGTGDAEGDTFQTIENLVGGSSIDLLFGNSEDNVLNGSTGNDRVIGRAGDDRLIGDAGFDKLYGNAGADIMSGGGNNDRFIYFNTSDSRPGVNRDVITDFNEDGQDRIEIGRLDADATRGGNQAFEFIGSDQFTDAGQLRFIQQEALGRTLILANTDDDTSSEFQIELTGIVDLDASDFIL